MKLLNNFLSMGYAALYSVFINFAVALALAPVFGYMARRTAPAPR